MTGRGHAGTADQQGMTLSEILVAIAIIGIGLVGLSILISVSTAAVLEGGQLSTATFLAEQMVERARAATWTADPPIDCLGVSGGDAAPVPAGAACHGARTSAFPDEVDGVQGYPGYQRTVRVTPCGTAMDCSGLTGDGLRRVVVSVRYAPLAVAGSPAPSPPRVVQLEWLASRP